MRLTFDDGQRVLGQGFAFRPAWWQRSYLPGAWSRWLDTLPEDPGGQRHRRIERGDLLRLARGSRWMGRGCCFLLAMNGVTAVLDFSSSAVPACSTT